MRQIKIPIIIAVATCMCASGCRTTNGLKWPSFGLAKQSEISPEATAVVQSELPPPSAASTPGTPILEKAKTATAQASDSLAGRVQEASGKVRQATANIVDKTVASMPGDDAVTDKIAVQTQPYPATAYPTFQANDETSDRPNMSNGVALSEPLTPADTSSRDSAMQQAPAIAMPNIPDLQAPKYRVADATPPTVAATSPSVPGMPATPTGIANGGLPNGDQKLVSAVGYATGPYSTNATTIPSQSLPPQVNTPSTDLQQGAFDPQYDPPPQYDTTISSRRSTMGPEFEAPQSPPVNMTPPIGTSSSAIPVHSEPSTHYPSTAASSVQPVAPASFAQPMNGTTVPGQASQSPPPGPNSFYQPSRAGSPAWRPGSTCRGASCTEWSTERGTGQVTTASVPQFASGQPARSATSEPGLSQSPSSIQPLTQQPPPPVYQAASQPAQPMAESSRVSTWR